MAADGRSRKLSVTNRKYRGNCRQDESADFLVICFPSKAQVPPQAALPTGDHMIKYLYLGEHFSVRLPQAATVFTLLALALKSILACLFTLCLPPTM